MNVFIVNPDMKVNMSLDEIISLSKQHINSQLPKRNRRKRKKYSKKDKDHSVALLSSKCGVGIYVSKKSCLLNADHRRRINQAISNRNINSDLLQKTKEIIPAEYKLIKTETGVERVLVPATEHFSKQKGQQSKPNYYSQHSSDELNSLPSKPPPLMSIPVLPPRKLLDTQMDVDDDDVEILNIPPPDKKHEVIDLECDLPVDVVEAKKICVPSASQKSLSERFTMLTGSFQF